MALTTTARGTPSGIKLKDGFSSVLTFSRKPNIGIWQRSSSPPGFDGGDPIDTTTMENTRLRTKTARHLSTQTDSVIKGLYDPAVISDLKEMINVEQALTYHYSDGSALDFFGYLQKAEFDPLEEGKCPEGTFTVVPTNQDPVTGAETQPVLTSVAGT